MRSPEAHRSVEECVETTVWLATLADGGPTEQFFRDKKPVPWQPLSRSATSHSAAGAG